MGADHRMYGPSITQLPQVVRLDWDHVHPAKSLSEVACQMIEMHAISARDRIGGSSLGGMVACEIAHQLKMKSVVLIGSARSIHELRWFARLGLPLANRPVFDFSRRLGRLVNRSLFFRMLADADSLFMVNMCHALRNWRGGDHRRRRARPRGGRTRDLLIKCPSNPDALILGGGHMIAWTHHQQVANALERWYQSHCEDA